MKYKKFMYHFHYPKNSIDTRNITEQDWYWIHETRKLYNTRIKQNKHNSVKITQDYKIINEMLQEHHPELLL